MWSPVPLLAKCPSPDYHDYHNNYHDYMMITMITVMITMILVMITIITMMITVIKTSAITTCRNSSGTLFVFSDDFN